jgi:hypothetical protein
MLLIEFLLLEKARTMLAAAARGWVHRNTQLAPRRR